MSKNNNTVEQDLQKREKSELIAIIKLMLQQQPELAWVLQSPLPTTGKSTPPTNASLYRSQIEKAVTAATEHYRDRSYREALKNTLATIQSIADTLSSNEVILHQFCRASEGWEMRRFEMSREPNEWLSLS